MSPPTYIDAVAQVAAHWADPDHPPRADAAETIVAASDRLTEPALTFALNQFMDALEPDRLATWLDGAGAASGAVGVVVDDPVPTETLRVALAAWGSGYRVFGRRDAPGVVLAQAVAAELEEHGVSPSLQTGDEEQLFAETDAVVALPNTETLDAVQARRDAPETPADWLLIPPTYSVAVIDGKETEEAREALAEDILLYEGQHRRSVAIVWAPQDLHPDPYLEAMAQFRGIVPAHASTPGALEMPKAFLEAQDAPHAYADGLQFLLSRDDPEPQPGAHIRWAEYDRVDAVSAWTHDQEARIHALVARSGLHGTFDSPAPWALPGTVHRPVVPDDDDQTVAAFLQALGPS
jgi:hypothetical protein